MNKKTMGLPSGEGWSLKILLMEEILHQYPIIYMIYTFQVVQDFWTINSMFYLYLAMIFQWSNPWIKHPWSHNMTIENKPWMKMYLYVCYDFPAPY